MTHKNRPTGNELCGVEDSFIHRLKWCHVFAIRSPFCGATPMYCA